MTNEPEAVMSDLTLDELLAEVTAENCHEEIYSQGPVGKEAW